MNCIWRDISEPDAGGWRQVECVRFGCGQIGVSPYPHARIIGINCRGLPLDTEWLEWLRLFAGTLGLNRAAATVAYIRWRWRGSRLDELPPGIPQPALPPLGKGPGTEMIKLIAMLGGKYTGCGSCQWMADKMDCWFADGVIDEHRGEIVAFLKEKYAGLSWTDSAAFAARAVACGLAFKLIGDPAGALVDEAIRRAEAATIPSMEPPTEDPCGYVAPWADPCSNPKPCPKHGGLKCWKCGAPAVTGCGFAGAFVCGVPECKEHPHYDTHA